MALCYESKQKLEKTLRKILNCNIMNKDDLFMVNHMYLYCIENTYKSFCFSYCRENSHKYFDITFHNVFLHEEKCFMLFSNGNE